MKQTIKILSVLAAVMSQILLVSCATDETLADDEQAIRLSVACRQPLTRATSGQASQAVCFDEGAKVNVTICTSDATPAYICNGAIFTASAPSSGKNTLTPPDVTRPPYYPNGDKTVTIKAFYPSTVNASTSTFTVETDQTASSDDETKDAYKRSDLMTATVTGQVKTNRDVNLEFIHRMAKINITATSTSGLIINSISLANVQTEAAYSDATGKWSGSGSAGSITVATGGTGPTLSGVALFPPQTIAGKTFIQVVTNKGTANYVVTSKEFQESHDYTANLEVELQNLVMTAAITDWSAASGVATVTKVLKYGMSVDPVTENFTYDGTPKVPATVNVWNVKGENDKTLLVRDTDYKLSFYNNTDVGSALVVAEGIGYYAGSAAVQSYTIGKATPTLSFTSGTAVTRNFTWNDTYQTTITEGSKFDGVRTWTSSDETVATVDGNGLVTILKPGVTTIKMATDGSGNYEAVAAQYTLTINKRSFKDYVSITAFGDYDHIYDGTAKEPVPVVYDADKRLGDNEGYYTINFSNNVNVGTGTVTLTGTGVYFDNTTVSKTFPIEKATPVITMTTTGQTIGLGTTYQCDATTDYGTVTYASSDPTVASVNSVTGLVTALKSGQATITASVAAGQNWNAAATPKTILITVKLMEESWTNSGAFTYTCPSTATYTFEVVGAAGATWSGASGGKGGIVKASKKLDAGTVVYIYVGAAGTEGYSKPGGQNGSDTGYGGTSGKSGGGSGGASTEIRIGGTAVGYRQIVAGGGGGSSGSRRPGKDGGSSSSGNFSQAYGQDVTYWSTGGGGGGGYRGGQQGGFGGGYGGSNYAASGWNVLQSGTSTNGPKNGSDTNAYNGYVKVTYEF